MSDWLNLVISVDMLETAACLEHLVRSDELPTKDLKLSDAEEWFDDLDGGCDSCKYRDDCPLCAANDTLEGVSGRLLERAKQIALQYSALE